MTPDPRDPQGAADPTGIEVGTPDPRGELAVVSSVILQIDDVGRIDRPQKNPVLLYMAKLGSDRSRRTQYYLLRIAVSELRNVLLENTDGLPEIFPWHQLEYGHVQVLQGALQKRVREDNGRTLAPNSVNRIISAVRMVLKMAKRVGLMSGDAYAVTSDIEPVHGSRIPKGRMLTLEELVALAAGGSEGKPTAPRDACIVVLMEQTGLRLAEVVSLTLDSIQNEEIRVVGKGNKERAVPMSGLLKGYLEKWLAVRGKAPGALFYRSKRKGLELTQEGLSDKGLYFLIQTLAKRMQLSKMSPHDFRRTFISRLLDEGVDIKVASELAGHSDINTTAGYDRRGVEARKAAIGKIDRSKP